MLMVERKNFILKVVDEQSAASVSALAHMLNVSEVTVRKMLNDLARQGVLRRTRGGAVSLSVPIRECDLRVKEKTNIPSKKAIARAAYALIDDYDTIFIDAGSTTLELVRHIRNGDKRNLSIVTNALNIALELLDSYDIEVVVTGGNLRHSVVSCVGPLAGKALSSLYIDKAFIGANNVSLQHGATTPKLIEGQVKQDAFDAAGKAFLLCDSSKFGTASMAKIAPLQQFACIITDDGLSVEVQRELRQANVTLLVVASHKKTG